MEKTLNITKVRAITKIDKPVIVFEVAGFAPILRNPKQALVDLHNSGRALDVPENALDRGIERMDALSKQAFLEALLDTVGAQLTADVTFTKAGELYAISEGHPALTDPNHPKFGQVKKAGDKLTAEKDTVWVEGFMSIPLTMQEKMLRNGSREFAKLMAGTFGFATVGATATAQRPLAIEEEGEEIVDELHDEAFAGSSTTPKKPNGK